MFYNKTLSRKAAKGAMAIVSETILKKMSQEKKHIEDAITDFLSHKDEVLFSYIFGSFVGKDNYHDIDVAVYLNDTFDKNDLMEFPYGYESGLISALNLLVRENIDFIVINNAQLTLQKKIIEHGILLFSKDERKRIHFENYIRKLFIDAAHLRKIRRCYLPGKIINA